MAFGVDCRVRCELGGKRLSPFSKVALDERRYDPSLEPEARPVWPLGGRVRVHELSVQLRRDARILVLVVGVVALNLSDEVPHERPVRLEHVDVVPVPFVELEALDGEVRVRHIASRIEVVDEQHVLELLPEVGGLELLRRDCLGGDGGNRHGLLGLERVRVLVGDDARGLELRLDPVHDEVRPLLGVGGISEDRLLDDVAHESLVPGLAVEHTCAVDLGQALADAVGEPNDEVVPGEAVRIIRAHGAPLSRGSKRRWFIVRYLWEDLPERQTCPGS